MLRPHITTGIEIKGAMSLDRKRWVIWNRDFGSSSSQLFIVRYVNLSHGENETEEEMQVASLLRAAGLEAKKWGLKKVTMWNPDEITVRAARRVVDSEAKIIDRETDSICSLMMHPEGAGSGPEEVEWLINEKYAWC